MASLFSSIIDTMIEYGLTVHSKEIIENKMEMDKIQEDLKPIILEIIVLYPEILNEIIDMFNK